MTIRFKNNTIEFESGSDQWVLAETPTGFSFFGTISATQFNSIPNIGLVAGYTTSGYANVSTIESFPFSSNANSTSVGNLTVGRSYSAGTSSTTHGYTAGGLVLAPTPAFSTVIDRFGFGATANASSVGNLTVARDGVSAQTSSTHGYTSGGLFQQTVPLQNASNVIDRFPFSATANASDVGDLTVARRYVTGQSSSSKGYASGGLNSGFWNTIDSFPFATNANATSVGSLNPARGYSAGQNSLTHGYTSGGSVNFPFTNIVTIDKVPFASNANATNVGSLSVGRAGPSGQNSTTRGYTSGGILSGGSLSNTIDAFPFASDGTATDVGDLTQAREGVAGQQY